MTVKLREKIMFPDRPAAAGRSGNAALKSGARSKVKPGLEKPGDIVRLAAAAALEKKAFDLIIFSVAGLTDYADYFLLASASSTRQSSAVAGNIHTILKKAGIKPVSVSGVNEGRWVLLDFGAVIIHVFHQPVREYYDLESIWSDAVRENMDEKELVSLLPDKPPFSANRFS
ncbi:MAG: ribosome silencing factor [Desulfarculales bacterium]|jgi:ribosome-associated protein|nr:ribosome silencing factor [Desulfarculales bacterium]